MIAFVLGNLRHELADIGGAEIDRAAACNASRLRAEQIIAEPLTGHAAGIIFGLKIFEVEREVEDDRIGNQAGC